MDSQQQLVVPAVVHWKGNHYAAILAQQGGLVEVADSIHGKPRWLSTADVRKEASGYFLVPRDKTPATWRMVGAAEPDSIRSRRYFQLPDSEDSCVTGPVVAAAVVVARGVARGGRRRGSV